MQLDFSAKLLEWVGTLFGIAGAILIAANIPLSPYGWVGFAVSSIALAGFALRIRARGLLMLQVCFMCTNALGLWRWLIQPSIGS